MTPDDIARRCTAWVAGVPADERLLPATPLSAAGYKRRFVCVEPDGPRRTWVLYEGGRQVGHVRGRQWELFHVCERWTWEAANAGREVLGG